VRDDRLPSKQAARRAPSNSAVASAAWKAPPPVTPSAGATGTRRFLRPLFSRDQIPPQLGRTRRENADLCLALERRPFRDGPNDRTSDVQLHIGESSDSGFDASHRPGMTALDCLRSRSTGAHSRDPLARNNLRGSGRRRLQTSPGQRSRAFFAAPGSSTRI
jgi:hypothetical protein